MTDLRPRHGRPGRPTTLARHGRLPRPRAWRMIVKFLVAAVAVLLVSGTSVAAIATWDVVASTKKSVALVDKNGKTVAPQVGAMKGSFNVLLAGSDSGDGNPAYGDRGESLNDVTMVLHVAADHKNATVVSFPRDMEVPIPSCPNPQGGTFDSMSSQKINNSLSYGGLPCTVLTVEKLTGLSIPYAAVIQFDGVIGMSNAVGGVPVCLAGRLDDDKVNPPLHLDAGNYSLKGGEALSYLRTRHSIGDGSDLGRISNQQSFLSSLVRTVKSANTLSDPVKVYGIAKAAASNMTLSDSMNNVSTLVSMGFALKGLDLNKVVFVQYPNHYAADGSSVEPTTDAADVLNTALAKDIPVSLSGTTGVGAEVVPSAGASSTPAPTSAASTPATQPSDGSSAVLPDSVTGQTAAQQTCAKPYNG